MKTKRSQKGKETGLNPLKPNANLKNREQLRKKLKGLFEKDKKNLHLLASDNKFNSNSSKISNGPRNTNSGINVKNNKKKHQNNSSKQKTAPDVLQTNTNARSKSIGETPKRKFNKTVDESSKQKTAPKVLQRKKNTKAKPIGNMNKSKFEGKLEPPKESSKVIETCDKAKPVSVPQSDGKNAKYVPTTVKKDSTKVKLLPTQSTVNTKGCKNKKIKTIQMHIENKPQKLTKNIKKVSKKQKTNDLTYRGPFRPESDSDASFENTSSKKQKIETVEVNQIVNNEQALTRVTAENENVDEDTDYDSSFGEYEENSEEDSDSYGYDDNSESEYSMETTDDEYSSDEEDDDSFSEQCPYFESESDRTYEPPDNLAEDVYIANGTAVKHDISASNEVGFDSDTSCAQIIEIPTTPVIQQNNKTLRNVSNGVAATESDKSDESDNSCPELVPIGDKRHAQDESDSDCCSDCTFFSGSDSEYDSYSEAEENSYTLEPPQMTPEIFQADTTSKQDVDIDIFPIRNSSKRSYTDSSPLNRIKSSKGNITKYKVITTNNQVVDPESDIKVKPKVCTPHVKKTLSNSNEKLHVCDKTSVTEETNTVQPKTPCIKSSIDTPASSSPHTKTQATSKNTSQKNSSFRTLFFNAINSNQVIVLIKDPLYLYGTVKLKLIAGSLEIFGYTPKQNEQLEIFSPRGYSSLKIESTKRTDTNISVLEKDLLSSLAPYFIRTDLEEVIEKFDRTKDAIVILERNDRSKKVNMLRKYMVEDLFPNMNSIQSDRPFYTSEFLLRCIITSNADKGMIVDPRWRSIIISSSSRVMAIGGKSVGKTTLVRYLINKNLIKYPKMLLIDLDIGQPEMFVPQTVSVTTINSPLLGPGYFLNKEPDKAFLVGQTNIVLLPQRYIDSVNALSEYCRGNKEYEGLPWIINTMGYNKGFGDELIVIICNLLHPTNIVQLECQREINNFDVIMSKDNLHSLECNIVGDMFSFNADFRSQHNLTLIPSVIPNDKSYQKEWDMNPRDMRHAMIVSRLSMILTGHSEWLTDIKPVSASIDDLQIINLGDDQTNTEDIVKSLAGNLIYLCQKCSGEAIECLGIGIVRGVDYSLRQVYLLPAVPLEVLKKVNCLAICGIPFPSSIFINQGPKVKGVASYIYNTVDKASSMYIKQIYHRPEHFLSGTHKKVLG